MHTLNQFIGLFKKLLYILNKKQKIQGVFVFFIIIFSSLIEMLSVSAVIPLIYAMISPDKILESVFYIDLMKVLPFSINSKNDLIFVISFCVIILFIFRCLLLIIFKYIRIAYENRIMKEIPLEMFSSYLSRPYIDMININSAEAMRGMSVNSTSVYYTIQGIFLIFSNLFNIVAIGVFLVTVDLVMSFRIILIALIFIGAISFLLKKTVRRSGKKFDYSAFIVTKNGYEALSGIKEITIMRRNSSFISKYDESVELKRRAELNYRFLQEAPSVIIDTVFICLLVVIVFFKISSGIQMDVLMAHLSVFTYGSMRILPSISSISSSITSIIYYSESFSNAYANIFEAREYKKKQEQFIQKDDCPKAVSFNKVSIDSISWRYAKTGKLVLDDISFEINKGDSIALVGKSGAGKSTLADILLGLLQPSDGMIKVDGINIYSIPLKWAKTVGFVPQTIFLLDDTIRNNILFGEARYDDSDQMILQALEQAQLKEFVDSLPNGLDTVVGERGLKFSGGQRQRLAIARALYNQPKLLVLDEATAALDSETEQAVMDAINVLKGKITLIIIAHRMSTIKECNKVYEIIGGKLEQKK